MDVIVNNDERTLPEQATVADLLRECGLSNAPCAVEVNKTLVPRGDHAGHRLSEGDVIEIVTLVGGG